MPPSVRWQLRPSSTSALAGRGGGNWDATCERCAAAAAKVSQQSTEVWRGSDGNKSHPPTEFPRQRVLSHLFPSRPSCLQSPGPSQLGQSRALEVHRRGHAGQRLHGSSQLPEVWGDSGWARVLGAVWGFPPIAVHMGSASGGDGTRFHEGATLPFPQKTAAKGMQQERGKVKRSMACIGPSPPPATPCRLFPSRPSCPQSPGASQLGPYPQGHMDMPGGPQGAMGMAGS